MTGTYELPELPPIPEGDESREPRKFRHLGRGGRYQKYECWEDAIHAYASEYARLAVKAERERCAKVAESFATCPCNGERGRCMENDPPRAVAAAIRKG